MTFLFVQRNFWWRTKLPTIVVPNAGVRAWRGGGGDVSHINYPALCCAICRATHFPIPLPSPGVYLFAAFWAYRSDGLFVHMRYRGRRNGRDARSVPQRVLGISTANLGAERTLWVATPLRVQRGRTYLADAILLLLVLLELCPSPHLCMSMLPTRKGGRTSR